LGLPATGRADHQNILRQHLFLEIARELLPTPAIAQGDGDRAFRRALADDVAIGLRNDLTRREGGHDAPVLTVCVTLAIGPESPSRPRPGWEDGARVAKPLDAHAHLSCGHRSARWTGSAGFAKSHMSAKRSVVNPILIVSPSNSGRSPDKRSPLTWTGFCLPP